MYNTCTFKNLQNYEKRKSVGMINVGKENTRSPKGCHQYWQLSWFSSMVPVACFDLAEVCSK